MQNNFKRNLVVVFCLALMACSVEQKPISYGKDACHYCKMNIVDQQHASEIVTKKGKVFKYDAIECMMNDQDNNKAENVALYLVMDYKNPNNFLDAKLATFLISENIPSPMNGNLSAFKTDTEAKEMQAAKSGNCYSWEELLNLSFKH